MDLPASITLSMTYCLIRFRFNSFRTSLLRSSMIRLMEIIRQENVRQGSLLTKKTASLLKLPGENPVLKLDTYKIPSNNLQINIIQAMIVMQLVLFSWRALVMHVVSRRSNLSILFFIWLWAKIIWWFSVEAVLFTPFICEFLQHQHNVSKASEPYLASMEANCKRQVRTKMHSTLVVLFSCKQTTLMQWNAYSSVSIATEIEGNGIRFVCSWGEFALPVRLCVSSSCINTVTRFYRKSFLELKIGLWSRTCRSKRARGAATHLWYRFV